MRKGGGNLSETANRAAQVQPYAAHVRVDFINESKEKVSLTFGLTEKILNDAKTWLAGQVKKPSSKDFYLWLAENKAELDSVDNSPSHVARGKNATVRAWHTRNELHRPETVGPARIWTGANGRKIDEYYESGKFIRREGHADLADIPGVGLRDRDGWRHEP